MALSPFPYSCLCARTAGWQLRKGSLFGRSSLQWGRAGPSDANVVGCHMRSPSISRIHAGECQAIASHALNDPITPPSTLNP